MVGGFSFGQLFYLFQLKIFLVINNLLNNYYTLYVHDACSLSIHAVSSVNKNHVSKPTMKPATDNPAVKNPVTTASEPGKD